MIGERLVQLRLARNLTLEALSEKMGGIVTKQALSKYEQNQAHPSPTVLARLSASLGVKANYFLSVPDITIRYVAYRKATSLSPREKARVESVVSQCLEDRIRVQTLVGQAKTDVLPWNKLEISSLEDTEKQASYMRNLWELGSSPISDVVDTFEEHQLCVLSIDADERFDGMAALGYDTAGGILAGAIISRQDIPGERQRLNLTHELGHLVLNIPEGMDEEKAAFRFGTAFLVPAAQLIREVGAKRDYIYISELQLLKKRYGISIQALLYRMLELGIINDSYYRRWTIFINKQGWKKREPNELARETPKWLTRNLTRLVSEGAMARDEAERILGGRIEAEEPNNIVRRRAFLNLPIENRRKKLAEQAKQLSEYYENEVEYFSSEDEINDYK